MKLQYPWENDGLRFLLTIESRALHTHSKMQHLSVENRARLTELIKDLMDELTKAVNNDAPQLVRQPNSNPQ